MQAPALPTTTGRADIDFKQLKSQVRTLTAAPELALSQKDRECIAHFVTSKGIESLLHVMAHRIGVQLRSSAARPHESGLVVGYEYQMQLLENFRADLITYGIEK